MTKSKDKFCRDNFCLVCCIRIDKVKVFLSILYFIIIYSILLRTKTLTSFGGIMERVQILVLIAFLFLVNIAQMADEILLVVCLLLRHQYLRNQVALLTIEYCRRQRRQACRHNPYFWKLPRPNQSWFEIHYNDRRIPGDYFRKQLRMNQSEP